MYENKELCKRCGGKCCNTCPGLVYPEDVGFSEEKVKELLSTGNYALDWWEGDPRPGKNRIERAYFLLYGVTMIL